MYKQIRIIYTIFWSIFLFSFLILFATFHLDIRGQRIKDGYRILTSDDYKVESALDYKAPINQVKKYIFHLDDIEGSHEDFIFYTIHQNAEVYLDGKRIYSMKAKTGTMTGKSPGCVWNQLTLSKEDNGKEMVVIISPVYETSIGIVPDFYFGDKFSIFRKAIVTELPALILSFFAIIIGVIYIFFNRIYYNSLDENSLFMMGMFAIQVGIWKGSETRISRLIFQDGPTISQVPFISLMLMCIPFTLFVKELCSTRKHVIWCIPCILSLADMGLTLFLQYFGILDYRQCLTMTHIVILFCAFFCIGMTIYEVLHVGWNKKLKIAALCIGLCFTGVVCDMIVYYMGNSNSGNIFGMLCFMVFIIVQGTSSAIEGKKLLDAALKADKYQQMAYHDQLTGLFNRTAYINYISSEEFEKEKCTVIVMDINNLKYCNDNWGHDKGDVYIRESAAIIKNCFGDIGMCYRMGGDEFTVLLNNVPYRICQDRVAVMKRMVEECKKVSPNFKMGVACGFKVYDQLLDYDISDTARRADKDMYHEKFMMKQEKKSISQD